MRTVFALVALAAAGGELVPLPASDEPLFHFAVRHDEVAALLPHFAGHTPQQTARAEDLDVWVELLKGEELPIGVGLADLKGPDHGAPAGAPAAAQEATDIFGNPIVGGKELAKLVEKAQAHPLGAKENPVRADMPGGQRAYLARLRCADGKAPTYRRVGNFGIGVYERIIDGYEVLCEGSTPAKSMIFMDMYHPGHKEPAAVPGFTIEPA